MHGHELSPPKVKLHVEFVYPEMKNELVHRGRQGGNTTIGEFNGSYVAWPISLLEKMG